MAATKTLAAEKRATTQDFQAKLKVKAARSKFHSAFSTAKEATNLFNFCVCLSTKYKRAEIIKEISGLQQI